MASRPPAKSVVAKAAALAGDITIEEVKKTETAEGVEARSVSARIRTVDDLLRHIEADLNKFEVAESQATKWEGLTADRQTGEPVVTELHRVFVRLRPRPGPGVRECVEAMIEAAKGEIKRPAVRKPARKAKADGWALLVIADPHFGKYGWRRTAGADYDLDIAARTVSEAAGELLAVAGQHSPERITVATLGDVFHYDSPHGTTTKGTPLERDGRLPKMLGVGTDAMLGVIDAAAGVAPCDTLVVAGNHDEALTFAFQRIILERFRGDQRVMVEQEFTPRKYLNHGGNLIGFTHGNTKARRKLPQLMAIEAAAMWSKCPYREWHTGHLHNQAAEMVRPIDTIDGVIVRTAPAICPADDWHAAEGYVGPRQAMELFIYDTAGGLASLHVAGPRVTIR